MKLANTYKGFLPYQSEFSHRYACWASNHRGWAKMKKCNKCLAKRRLKNVDKVNIRRLVDDCNEEIFYEQISGEEYDVG